MALDDSARQRRQVVAGRWAHVRVSVAPAVPCAGPGGPAWGGQERPECARTGPRCAGARCTLVRASAGLQSRAARGSGVVGVAPADRDDGDALKRHLVQNLFGAPSVLGCRLWSWPRLVHDRGQRAYYLSAPRGPRRRPPRWVLTPAGRPPACARQTGRRQGVARGPNARGPPRPPADLNRDIMRKLLSQRPRATPPRPCRALERRLIRTGAASRRAPSQAAQNA